MRLVNIFAVIITVCLCHPDTAGAQAGMRALPHVLVYKTKKNYRENVPVELSADKKTVVSYPSPGDIKIGAGPGATGPVPVLLHKGWLLDKRGVGKNTAFIKMTYQQYSALKTAPGPADLYKMIIDKDPMTALYDCGQRNAKNNSEQELNNAIDQHLMKKKYKQIK